jgi:hypothetical protein
MLGKAVITGVPVYARDARISLEPSQVASLPDTFWLEERKGEN